MFSLLLTMLFDSIYYYISRFWFEEQIETEDGRKRTDESPMNLAWTTSGYRRKIILIIIIIATIREILLYRNKHWKTSSNNFY